MTDEETERGLVAEVAGLAGEMKRLEGAIEDRIAKSGEANRGDILAVFGSPKWKAMLGDKDPLLVDYDVAERQWVEKSERLDHHRLRVKKLAAHKRMLDEREKVSEE